LIVAVDARHLAGGRGVAHYTAALLAALPDDQVRAYAPPPALRRPLYASAALLGRPRLDRLAGGADVVWIPAPAPVAVSRDVPYVLSVHDLSWIERPQDFTAYERAWHRVGRLERLARGAAAVLCLSEATKATVQRHWNLPDEQLHVLYPGVTRPEPGPRKGPDPLSRPDLDLARPFFLAVGALEPRKAPDLLVRAHQLARREGLEADLVFAGTGRIAVEGDGVHALGRVEDLGPLYRDALALVMPSYLEGFGFPTAEAALAGTPSIVADLPVYDETLGVAAVRFPAGDERALADALLAVERDGAPVADVSRFTWERAARQLREILESVAR
jgi:glycosyltransferase involved in cell wall biosynthesis